MLRLLLLRHAKSDWGHPNLADHERPLAPRGLRDAPRMGKFLREQGLTPKAALVSTARRAKETAELVLEASGAEPSALQLTSDLYGASPDQILETVREDGGEASPLLVVAHNPGMEDLVARLGGGPHEPLPTAALAVVRFEVASWAELSEHTASVELIQRPRELKQS